jgi:hypothetical protein
MIMMSADPDAARIQMEGNKQAALARYTAEKTSQASTDFEQYQLMKHNLAKLRNKTTPAAELLASKIKSARAKLIDNPHFPQKTALESPNVVLLHPETGTLLQHNAGIEHNGKKHVVVGVDPTQRSVTLRTYGGVGPTAHMSTHPVAELGQGVKPFDYDEAAETAHMSKEFGEYTDTEEAAKLNMETIRNLPAGVFHANEKKIQARLKRNMAEYKLDVPYGASVPYQVTAGDGSHQVGDTEGDIKLGSQYGSRELAERADHELMLPTPENRERMFAEYAKTEQSRELRAGESSYKKGRQQPAGPIKAMYQQTPKERHHGLDTNPWAGAGDFVFGKDFSKQAHAKFLQTQGEHIRHAPTFAEAVRRAAPTIKTNYAGHKWPKNTLAVLYARAKRDGILDQPLADVVPKKDTYGYAADEITKDVWKSKSKGTDGSAYGSQTTNVRDSNVLPALVTLAKDSGYNDLAAAMIMSAKPPVEAAKELVQLPLSDEHVIAAVAHLATKHPELAAMNVLDLFDGDDYQMKRAVGHEDMKFGELAKQMRLIQATEAASRQNRLTSDEEQSEAA